MATLREITDELADDLGRWNDEAFKENLRFAFKHHAARYTRQTIDKHNRIDPVFEVDLSCVSVTKADKAECCNIKSNCDILSTPVLPKPIRLSKQLAITYAGSVDKQNQYPIIQPTQAPFIEYEKWTNDKPRAYWLNQKLYFVNVPELLENVDVRMVAEDPEQANNFINCSGEACFTIDSEYPIPEDMVNMIYRDMINGKLKLYMSENQPVERDNEVDQQ